MTTQQRHTAKGVHHIGLATHDMEATLHFYENLLGFETKVCDLLRPDSGGTIRHAFLDMGNEQMLAFMECNNVPGIADDFDAGINQGLGIGMGVMHFAFRVDNVAELESRRQALRTEGLEVTDLVDHGWCQSIYFKDPNNLQLEFCCLTGELESELLADRDAPAWQALARS